MNPRDSTDIPGRLQLRHGNRASRATARPPADTAGDQLRDKAAAAIEAPADDEFLLDFMLDAKLEKLAEIEIEMYEEFSFIAELGFKVIYLWKRTGGKSSGMAVLGKCVRLTGLVKHFAKADFVIWFGADHNRGGETDFAALMYHELCHIDRDEKDQPSSQGHEFEGFAREVMRFGIWRKSMRPIAVAFQHSSLPEESE